MTGSRATQGEEVRHMKTRLIVGMVSAMLLWATETTRAAYSDAINVNYGLVTGTQGTPQTRGGTLAGNWNNISTITPGTGTDGDPYNNVWALPTQYTAKGDAIPGFNVTTRNGGWGRMVWGSGGGAAGTLLETVVLNNSTAKPQWGQPAHWNWYATIRGIPASWTNRGFDAFALNDGAWVKIGSGLTTTNQIDIPLTHLVVAQTAAYQFLKIGLGGSLLIVR